MKNDDVHVNALHSDFDYLWVMTNSMNLIIQLFRILYRLFYIIILYSL